VRQRGVRKQEALHALESGSFDARLSAIDEGSVRSHSPRPSLPHHSLNNSVYLIDSPVSHGL
jgi:hypothetical protein